MIFSIEKVSWVPESHLWVILPKEYNPVYNCMDKDGGLIIKTHWPKYKSRREAIQTIKRHYKTSGQKYIGGRYDTTEINVVLEGE